MAEQISRRAQQRHQLRRSTAPFETHTVRFGAGSLNLKDSLDAMEGWARLTNVWHENEGEATARPGQTALATHGSGATCHSIRQLRDPRRRQRHPLLGRRLLACTAASPARPPRSTPATPATRSRSCPHRPPLSGEPWMFVADRARMRKIRADGLALPIGLPAPATPDHRARRPSTRA